MRIGFIAMSGTRACNEELLKLGLTLPGFVERSRTIASLPSLGLLTLAGMTPPEHAVSYHEVADIRALDELPGPFDLVAISTFSAQANEAYALARRYREQGTLAVIGGLHATCCPDEPMRLGGAAAAVGEGELVWPQILRDAERGRLKPIYGRRPTSGEAGFDLADSPMPAFELLDIDKYNRLTVQTGRGCPWKCSFCASSILLTPRFKQKPGAKVLAEIDRIRELWSRPFIEFADDNSFVNRKYWHELLPELRTRRIKWFTETDLSVAEDEPLLELMRDAGCAEVLIGLESPVERDLDGLELRRNWKRYQAPKYKTAIQRIQSHGIRVNACFVLGLDGQGPAAFDAVYDFVQDAAPFDVQITFLTPFPGTPLYAQLERAGRLLHPGNWDRCTLYDVNYAPTDMTVEELETRFRELSEKLYNQAFTDWRREQFKKQWRPQRANRWATAG